ncbi:MAG: M1 family metallopeptidase, partial [Candidatus Omnitrophica bacterium]|nr:M1 family metallopeptidase [Candidatus Omnitrophota bacterium]
MRYLPLKLKSKNVKRKTTTKNLKLFSFTLYFCLFTFSFCLSFASEPPRYEINAHLDTNNHKISAEQKVKFTNNSNQELNEIYFHIYPHRRYTDKEIRLLYRYAAYFKIDLFPGGFQGGDLKIRHISYSKGPLVYMIEGEDQTILKVNLDSALSPGESCEIDIDFQLDIPHAYGRFGWHKDIITLARWYPILSVFDKNGWHNYPFYIYHQPYISDASYYKVKFTVDQNEKVASSGSLKEETLNPDGTKTLSLETVLPVRDFSLSVSKSLLVYAVDDGKTKIKSYYLSGDEQRAQEAARHAQGLMKFYSQHFVEYPYPEFSIVPSYLGFGGMQSSCLVFIDTRAYKLPGFLHRYFDFLISHETGHQWFYNIVGSDEYKEMFLDEGFNSYWLLKYLETKYGQDVGVMVLPRALQWLIPNFSFVRAQLDRYSFVAKNGIDRPVLGALSSFKEPSSIFSITYGKGSKIVDMLNYVMGEDAFKRLTQRYFNEFKFKNIFVADLEKIASQEAKTDLNWFFDDWLKTTKICDYAIKGVYQNKIVVENIGDIPMPVELEVELEDGSQLNYLWNGAEKSKEFLIDNSKKIKSARLDPQKRILELDRTNNHWRRQVDFRPVILYYPLYEIPVFLEDDAYSFVFGPQADGSDFGVKLSLQKPQDNLLYISHTYNFNEERIKNTFGFQQQHLSGKLLKWGIEAFDYNDLHSRNDQDGVKLYLRRDLWPVSYGLLDENDHITVYFIRDRDFKSALT